ncbi:MAG TPA: DUF349 domain-containing protein, partial [Rubrivivax sp.]|nr:DUF349 domain-containing protein [Rubrivivax sp.]
MLDAAQRAGFESLLAQLSTLTRERADATLKRERWTAQAQRALVELRAACSEAAAGTQHRGGLAAVRAAAQQIIESAPEGDASAALRDALGGACEGCERLDERLAVFDELLEASTTEPPAEKPRARATERPPEQPSEGPKEPTAEPTAELTTELTTEPMSESTTEPTTDLPTQQPTGQPEPAANALPADYVTDQPAAAPLDPVLRWQQLPPLADALLGDLLDRRFEQWQHSRREAQQARLAQQREQVKARQKATRHERTGNLVEELARAEAALAEGHPAATHKHLVRIDELLHGGASTGDLRGRIDALQAGYAQLKGWQHWAGGRARDELVLQAEALAAATAGAADAPTVKLSTRQRVEVIDDLRARWKELDRLGGATSRSLWQRFDAALEVAYQPVAAQLAALRAARQQNLLARQQLLEALESVALPEPGDGEAVPDWRSMAGALDHFRSAWHKLGPLEHTVPHKARPSLVERMKAAVARIEAPLHEARRAARLGREQLVAHAHALAAEASAGAHGRDLV